MNNNFYNHARTTTPIKFMHNHFYNSLIPFYVKEQLESFCLHAVRKNYVSLRYVKEQNFKICKEALKQSRFARHYIRNIDMYDELLKLRYVW